ncbi:MAG: KilA-N domain-containing protein, partial [Endomicrobium sp.]|nr:KilA-N domain-containing protein [Endomicrobium sp.]
GITSKAGRYDSGTFAHSDIAFEFAAWLSAEFKFYLIKEFQRLKHKEQKKLSLEWNLQRTISKVNYHIHTNAIKQYTIPPTLTKEQINTVYASEADLLNAVLFGKTALQWRKKTQKAKGKYQRWRYIRTTRGFVKS